jgi:uncharacterized membrane protein (UPF0127 family)
MLMNKKVAYIWIFVISFLAIFAGIYWFLFRSGAAKLEVVRIAIGAQTFSAEYADTIRSRSRGLSGHAPLADKEGMYFSFPIKAKYPIWMKGMTFPIDIVWIADGKVVGFTENAPIPESKNVLELPTYSPPEAVDAALELNAGTVKKFGFALGDPVSVER